MGIKATHEILTTRFWDMAPDILRGFKQIIDNNILNRISLDFEKKEEVQPFLATRKKDFKDKIYVGNARYIQSLDELEEDDEVINVIRIDGPVLRNGDACSYGSKEHRDLLIAAANMEQTIGHLIYIDTGGGSSEAKYDYEQAINYIKEKNQPVIALVDGMCCSAGYAVASMCDEVYYVNGKNEVGCIGTMAAFYAQKDGDINAITQERYVEVIADLSPEKNKVYIDAAKGDDALLRKEVNQSAKDFQDMVRKYRPPVTEEQLKGEVFFAEDVVGTMVDSQNDFDGCVQRILELSAKRNPKPALSSRPASANRDQSTNSNKKENNQNQTTMKSYPKMMAALGQNDLQSDKDNGVYLNEQLCDTLESSLTGLEQKSATLDAKMQEIANLNTQIANDRQAHKEAIDKMTSANADAVANLQTEHANALQAAKNASAKETDGLKARIADLEKQLGEKEAEIKQLSESTTQEPKPQDPPKDNNAGDKQTEDVSVAKPVLKEGMTPAQKREAEAKRMDELRKLRGGQ